MKLKPTQVVGLVAIVVFGGGMIFRLTQPSERERMEKTLASLPRIEVPAPEFPMPDLSAINTPVIPPSSVLEPGAGTGAASSALPPAAKEVNYLALGSQAAKDDLYCGGVLDAHFQPTLEKEGPNVASPLIEQFRMLNGAGMARLRTEGLSNGDDWGHFLSTYSAKGTADYSTGALRLPVATCIARAKALPADTPKLP